MVFSITEGDPNKFEKPTHQVFYCKVLEKIPELDGLTWNLLDNKMRNLRSAYQKAMEWQKNTGSGLLADGKESSVREYIVKLCPFYDKLHDIFAEKRNVNPLHVLESSSTSTETLISTLDNIDDMIVYDETGDQEFSTTIVLTRENPTPPSTSHRNARVVEGSRTVEDARIDELLLDDVESTSGGTESRSQTRKRSNRSSAGGSLATLIDLQEKRIKLEETKYEKEVDLKKMELNNDLKIRELELQSKERIEMARIKAECETNERVKRYEIELKAQRN